MAVIDWNATCQLKMLELCWVTLARSKPRIMSWLDTEDENVIQVFIFGLWTDWQIRVESASQEKQR